MRGAAAAWRHGGRARARGVSRTPGGGGRRDRLMPGTGVAEQREMAKGPEEWARISRARRRAKSGARARQGVDGQSWWRIGVGGLLEAHARMPGASAHGGTKVCARVLAGARCVVAGHTHEDGGASADRGSRARACQPARRRGAGGRGAGEDKWTKERWSEQGGGRGRRVRWRSLHEHATVYRCAYSIHDIIINRTVRHAVRLYSCVRQRHGQRGPILL